MSKYEITEEIIREYLNTLETDQEAGLASHVNKCPVAKAMRYKYGKTFIVTEEHYYPSGSSGEMAPTPQKIAELIERIDRIRNSDQPVSRDEVEGVMNG